MAKKKTASPVMCEPDRDWQAENDLRTLKDAEQIRADKGRMARAAAVLKKEQSALQRVGGTIAPAKAAPKGTSAKPPPAKPSTRKAPAFMKKKK